MLDKMDIISEAVNEDEINSGRAGAMELTALTLIFGPLAIVALGYAISHPREAMIIGKVIWSSITQGQ